MNTVLKFISFKDSLYRTPPDLFELDQKSRQGHMVLVEGVKTGSALVRLFRYYTIFRIKTHRVADKNWS